MYACVDALVGEEAVRVVEVVVRAELRERLVADYCVRTTSIAPRLGSSAATAAATSCTVRVPLQRRRRVHLRERDREAARARARRARCRHPLVGRLELLLVVRLEECQEPHALVGARHVVILDHRFEDVAAVAAEARVVRVRDVHVDCVAELLELGHERLGARHVRDGLDRAVDGMVVPVEPREAERGIAREIRVRGNARLDALHLVDLGHHHIEPVRAIWRARAHWCAR